MENNTKIELRMKEFFLKELKQASLFLESYLSHRINNDVTKANERMKSLVRMLESDGK